MSCIVKRIEEKNLYQIIEENELQILVLAEVRCKDYAYSLCRGLNLGKGFGGETPSFFAKKVIRKDAELG